MPKTMRYNKILGLTIKAVPVRLAALVPFLLAYFQPFSPWLRLVALFTPVLWVLWVWQARVRYGRQIAAAAGGETAQSEWGDACKGRIRLMRRRVLPLCILLAILLVLLWVTNAFSALYGILFLFGGLATIMSTLANFVSRLLIGDALIQPAGVIGGMLMLTLAMLIALLLFGSGVFQTSLYRFGYTADMPKWKDMKPLLRQNLRLWLPTLALLFITLVFSYQELGLLFANVLSVSPAFHVKLQWYQIILLVLSVGSYFALLPVRKYNTAAFAAAYGNDKA